MGSGVKHSDSVVGRKKERKKERVRGKEKGKGRKNRQGKNINDI